MKYEPPTSVNVLAITIPLMKIRYRTLATPSCDNVRIPNSLRDIVIPPL